MGKWFKERFWPETEKLAIRGFWILVLSGAGVVLTWFASGSISADTIRVGWMVGIMLTVSICGFWLGSRTRANKKEQRQKVANRERFATLVDAVKDTLEIETWLDPSPSAMFNVNEDFPATHIATYKEWFVRGLKKRIEALDGSSEEDLRELIVDLYTFCSGLRILVTHKPSILTPAFRRKWDGRIGTLQNIVTSVKFKKLFTWYDMHSLMDVPSTPHLPSGEVKVIKEPVSDNQEIHSSNLSRTIGDRKHIIRPGPTHVLPAPNPAEVTRQAGDSRNKMVPSVESGRKFINEDTRPPRKIFRIDDVMAELAFLNRDEATELLSKLRHLSIYAPIEFQKISDRLSIQSLEKTLALQFVAEQVSETWAGYIANETSLPTDALENIMAQRATHLRSNADKLLWGEWEKSGQMLSEPIEFDAMFALAQMKGYLVNWSTSEIEKKHESLKVIREDISREADKLTLQKPLDEAMRKEFIAKRTKCLAAHLWLLRSSPYLGKSFSLERSALLHRSNSQVRSRVINEACKQAGFNLSFRTDDPSIIQIQIKT